LVALAILLLVSACSPLPSRNSSQNDIDSCLGGLKPAVAAAGLFVEPDDGEKPVIDELDAASCTIDISVYILSDDLVIGSLVEAASRGVRVRVMLEQYPFGGSGNQDEVKTSLEREGIEVRWSGSDIRFSHAKFALVDRQVALIMNQNLTNAAFQSNREFGVMTTDHESVDQAQEIFDRDWQNDPIHDVEGPLIVSPTNSRARLLAIIEGADRSIDFYAEVIRDEEIIAALGTAESRGVEVRLIVDASMDEDTQVVAVELYNMGVEIRLSETLYIHAKLMVIDREVAVVGSQNFTQTSLDDNRELAIVVTDSSILERCLAVFERDWQRAIPGSPTE
jgi:phosphatidylserine/phosphatidylglycerophosphate/cardiolipin synthase-like enzyme